MVQTTVLARGGCGNSVYDFPYDTAELASVYWSAKVGHVACDKAHQ